MNRTLLIFSIFLILVGLGLGATLFFIIGFVLLFPALLLPSKAPPQGPPTSSGQQPVRRTSPQPAPTFETVSQPAPPQVQASQSMPSIQAPQTSYSPSYSPSLFPTSMFPSASQPAPTSMFPSASQPIPTAQLSKETRVQAHESRDDVLELGVLMVLLKLAFG